MLWRDVSRTAAGLDALAAGDGAAWQQLYGLWESVGPEFLDALFVPFPPVRPGLWLAAKLRGPGMLRFARFGVLPVRRLLEEEFAGPGSLLLAGSALHADLMPESAGSALPSWPALASSSRRRHGSISRTVVTSSNVHRPTPTV